MQSTCASLRLQSVQRRYALPLKRYCSQSFRVSGGLIVRVSLQNLGLELVGTKRLFDETGNARLLSLNDLLYRRIGSHHDER